jgi:LysR family hydrogen peroxide-inducible transcriptional activator
MDVTLRQLEYAVAVARLRHFGRAAEACHSSQPALSAGIAQLEAAAGLRLFERGRGGVRTTTVGEEVVRRAHEVLARVDDLRGAVAALRTPFSAPLRLGVIPTVAPFTLPRVVPALRAHFPTLRLLLREDRTASLVRALEEGTLDVALLAIEADLRDCETIALWRDPFLLAVPREHRLARARSKSGGAKAVGEKALRNERVLLLEEGHCLRQQALSLCERLGVPEVTDLRATSLTTLTHMAAGGLGITVLPAMAAEGAGSLSAAQGPLVVLPFRAPEPYRTIGLAFRSESARRAEIETVARVLRRRPPAGTTTVEGG